MSNPTNSNALDDPSPSEIGSFDSLAELALDLRWSWNHAGDALWRQLNPEMWKLTHNPWAILQAASRDQIESVKCDPEFCKCVQALVQARRKMAETPAWFQLNHPQSPLNCVAYFSMEFMLSEALPIYSGGLGNVAGDQLKAASDLGIPVIGVGLLYQQGYFRQEIDKNGEQQAFYPYNDPGQLPITPLRQPNGEWLRLEIKLPGYSVWLRTWQVQVGRTKLYLLDSNDPANPPVYRGITSELYGGSRELRLRQELMLGIGGWRLLHALGLHPTVCHLNEGHAAFAVLERARGFMEQSGLAFDVALAATRAGNIFTTHTAVSAGFDRFDPTLIEQHLGRYARDRLGISMNELLALGRLDPNDPAEPFNLACLAIRGSGTVNGVSRLHGKVSRHLFAPLFPHWPVDEVPVGYVTNGVHMPTWDSADADELWTTASGKERWLGPTEALQHDIRNVPDARLWQLRGNASLALVEFARERLARQLISYDAPQGEIEAARHALDPNVMTLGFARRFASYKRPNLLLHDPQRLLALLNNPARPVQLILAGKAHPEDRVGRNLVRQWQDFIRHSEARQHVIFLADYDMLMSAILVQGVDVWLNTPRRPWEACGTSGMKALVNGGLNLSELDGWWAEAYSPDVGWALGDGQEHNEDPAWDAAEAEELYRKLEEEIIPEFYNRDERGIPGAWLARMRESMARLTPLFSANRSVREYTERFYLPAARAYLERAADNGAQARRQAAWRQNLGRHWKTLRFGEMRVTTQNRQHRFEIEVDFGQLDPGAVRVELYADGTNPELLEMEVVRPLPGSPRGFVYAALLAATRPATDYTARMVPWHRGVAVPLEAPHILWQR